MDVREFILARVSEDEEVARAASEAGYGADWRITPARRSKFLPFDVVDTQGARVEPQADHITRHDPARVLAQCAALREVVAAVASMGRAMDERWGADTLQALAAIWSGHADFDPAWVA